MVVDDDPAILRAMQRRANRVAGLQLALAESGEAALALVHERIPIDLVVLDVMMGGIDGIETCRRLRLIAPGARVIVASGNMTPALVREAADAGALAALDKPYDLTALLGGAPDAARDERIAAHLDLAANIARGMARRYGTLISPEEIGALARLGLCEAASRYDATRGEPFVAFAERRIRGAIQDELRRLSPRTRKGGAALRAIDAARRALVSPAEPNPSDDAIALRLSLTIDELALARAPNRVVYAPLDDDNPTPAGDPSPAERVERAQLHAALARARDELEAHAAQVMELFYERGMSTSAIARELGVPAARVVQIHSRALGTLRRLMAA